MHKKPTISCRSNLWQNNSATKGLINNLLVFFVKEWFAHNLKQLAGRLTKWHKEFGVGETTDGAAMSRGHRHHAAEHEDDQEQVIPLLLLCPSLTIL